MIHEITHATIFSFGLDFQEFDDEQVCRFMESHIDEILRLTDSVIDNFRNQGEGTDERN